VYFLVHYGEIALKGRNRPSFEAALRNNIRDQLSPVRDARVITLQGRMLVKVPDESSQVASVLLQRVFGISWYAPAFVGEASFEWIKEKAEEILRNLNCRGRYSFGVRVKRANKLFPKSSQEIANELGAYLKRKLDYEVDLSQPCLWINLEIAGNLAIIHTEKQRALGGLPVGISGSVIHLLSGGIDSPVAAWLLMKRGVRPIYLHFYPTSSTEEVLSSKLLEIVKVLARFQGRSSIILSPFADYQLTFLDSRDEPVRFKRFMRVFAEAVAQRIGALGISTGDSIGQVYSQTLSNLKTVDSGALLPVYRPLATYDKEEIVQLAKSIGTYDLSIKPYRDCCSILTSGSSKATHMLAPSDLIETSSLVQRLLERSAWVEYDPHTGSLETRVLREVTAQMHTTRG
jgi:thiamine biosynthesis protein ThiI